jgi:hypothetical protein
VAQIVAGPLGGENGVIRELTGRGEPLRTSSQAVADRKPVEEGGNQRRRDVGTPEDHVFVDEALLQWPERHAR